MLSRLLLCLLLSFSCFLASSQGRPVSGKVVGEDGKPLAAATVTLLRSATDSFKTLTDSAGTFSINASAGPYRIVITHTSYTEHRLENPSPEALHFIQLTPAAKALDAVVVKADVPLVEADAGSITYNVSKSMDAPGLTALEVLKKAPGVFVLNDNAVTLHGKGGVLILLDGKQTYLSGQELTDLLKSMPATSVRSIEIIANPQLSVVFFKL